MFQVMFVLRVSGRDYFSGRDDEGGSYHSETVSNVVSFATEDVAEAAIDSFFNHGFRADLQSDIVGASAVRLWKFE